MGTAYQQPFSSIVWTLRRAFAGAINNFVLHGFPYSGNYGNTTWPGFTAFAYIFSEQHGPRQPAFPYYRDMLDWASRSQFIMQTGVPKMDMVFWLKNKEEKPATVYSPTDLQAAGETTRLLGNRILLTRIQAIHTST